MTKKDNLRDDERWEFVHNAIIEFASGNFNIPEYKATKGDDFDALAQGIIMLGEELKASTISYEYLSSVYSGITDLLIVLDNDLNIQEVNDAVVDVLEFERKDFGKLNISHLCPEVLYNDSIRFPLKQLTKKGKLNDLELNLFTKSGKSLVVSASFSVIKGNWRKGHDILFTAKDISDLVATKTRLVERNQELSTLVYRISHDLRSPLSNAMGLINMLVDMLQRKQEDRDSVISVISMMQTSVNRLDEILRHFNQLLYIGEEDERNENIDFAEMVGQTLKKLYQSFEDVPVEVKKNITVDSGVYSGPRRLIEIMFYNILHNSFVYSNQDLVLQLSIVIKERGKHIMIEIGDNGIGINKTLSPDVFKMFVKASKNAAGSGLGLYFVKNVVERLNGSISLQSKENQGTQVKILLPV